MPLYSRSLIVYGTFSLLLFLIFPILFIVFWETRLLYAIVSLGISLFVLLFIIVYRSIYKAEMLQKARRRYRENIEFLDVLPNALFIWRLSVWMMVVELLLTGVFIGYMSGNGFLLMYPLWMVGTGVVFSVSGHLSEPGLKAAGSNILFIAVADLALLMLYLFTGFVDIYTAHYLQIGVTTLTVGIYPLWLGVRHAR